MTLVANVWARQSTAFEDRFIRGTQSFITAHFIVAGKFLSVLPKGSGKQPTVSLVTSNILRAHLFLKMTGTESSICWCSAASFPKLLTAGTNEERRQAYEFMAKKQAYFSSLVSFFFLMRRRTPWLLRQKNFLDDCAECCSCVCAHFPVEFARLKLHHTMIRRDQRAAVRSEVNACLQQYVHSLMKLVTIFQKVECPELGCKIKHNRVAANHCGLHADFFLALQLPRVSTHHTCAPSTSTCTLTSPSA